MFLSVRKIFLGVMLIGLTACNRNITSDVTRFHQLPTPQSGETVEIVSMNPDFQKSIEFSEYANMLGSRLSTVGYAPPADGNSTYIARLGYEVQALAGVEVDDGPRTSVGVGVGSGGYRGTSVGIGISTSFGSSEPKRDYRRSLYMEIINRADGTKLYEGNVHSVGPENSLPLVMPYLIDAMFQDFPGENGTTTEVKAPAPRS